jgi:hypothetical protein
MSENDILLPFRVLVMLLFIASFTIFAGLAWFDLKSRSK